MSAAVDKAKASLDIARAAQQLLSDSFSAEFGEYGPDMQQATDRVSHLKGTKEELLGAIAYLALQVQAYRRIANEDAALALVNIESIISRYKERRTA